MKSLISRSILLTLLAAPLVGGCAGTSAGAPKKTLQAFANEQEISDLFSKWREERQRRLDQERSKRQALGNFMAAQPAPAASPGPATAAGPASESAAADSVTNVQHAGIDEGGIVKLHGDHLVILRRGRLFTIDVRDDQLRPVAAVDAFGPGIEPRGTWYDEMLIARDSVIVIGYSYARGGTEIGVFDISPRGELRHKATYHLRSNDYYSSRNYSSRLIGTKLIFYTPLRISPWDANPFASFPAMRRWRPDAPASDFKRIAPATRIYRVDEDLDPYAGIALHTVAICDLAKAELDCASTAVLGPVGRSFYVSPSAVYVWTSAWRGFGASKTQSSALFRMPLEGSAPSALKTAGAPIDQFSFLEDDGGHLNVLLRGSGSEGMFGAERPGGQLALLRVPLASFSDGKDAAPRDAYRMLPSATGGALQNRYVGPFLLYGAGAGWSRGQNVSRSSAYALRYVADTTAHELPLMHGVDRIEALGSDAVVIGTDGRDLHFSSLRLGSGATVSDRYTRPNAAQGETRSHGFYYRRETPDEGLIGLPIIGGGQAASRQLRRESASVLFLRNRTLKLSELGALESHATNVDDACRASCVDWYGNSRPLFLKNRIFALLGYEIVEGSLTAAGIVEKRRTTFTPHWVDQVR